MGKGTEMTTLIDWTKPIETLDGEPAGLCHNDKGLPLFDERDRRLVWIDSATLKQRTVVYLYEDGSGLGYPTPIIRNVPARVKCRVYLYLRHDGSVCVCSEELVFPKYELAAIVDIDVPEGHGFGDDEASE